MVYVDARDTVNVTERALINLRLQNMSRAQQDIEDRMPIDQWAERDFWALSTPSEDNPATTAPFGPIRLTRHQRAILLYVFSHHFSTVVYSTPKKSGKTTLAAVVARYVAEKYGPYAEIFCVANDLDQAKSRAFDACVKSVSLNPAYNNKRRELPGQWTVFDREMIHKPTGSKIKALSTDYKGEAGANPTLTVWTELWGYVQESSLRFWTELTPVPTREFSMRWVETYAGFTGESDLLESLHKLGHDGGRQLTAGELGDPGCFVESPNPDDLVPVWVNEDAGLFMYWDEGLPSRRMPWQQGEPGRAYYGTQEATLRPSEFNRIHLNMWSGSKSEFVPIEWWDACYEPHPLKPGERTPLVVAVDASVSGDCTCLIAVSRHPERHGDVCMRYAQVWYPHTMPGGKMNYDLSITPVIERLIKDHVVVQVAYDVYQLHHWVMEQRTKNPSAWYREFPQGGERLLADKELYDAIRDRNVFHDGGLEMRTHVANCAAQIPPGEENRLRLIKKGASKHIDLAVALSMANHECRRLLL